ncbi:uncharacterized protein LOC114192148 isoform X2 [Vigna unguiculata]|uniref:uncharacterized protein LOC114192148 isoform X2 n=1 Tax=Vigna unguiculata TaxID=3917 RepID=UPI001015E8FF|nr:uncharacterized protein LOC114192148 isoform X2 [Vigna unguiculata]
MARRAKSLASDQVEGSFKEQFRRIHDYAYEILRCNPGSTVKVKVDEMQGESIFGRFYTCFKACKDAFVLSRPFIGLDGCFLKRKYGGELLTAVAKDANDQMLPLAYAIVEVENKETWKWFLEILVDDLGGPEVCGACTFMSDQQKGLLPAIQELLPGAEQRFCMRHLYSNFRKRFGGQKLKNLMWKAATVTHHVAWERVMIDIKKENEDAFKYLIAIPPRCKPVISMLEDIRIYMMKRWQSKRQKLEKMEGQIYTKVNSRLQEESKKSRYWIPSCAGGKVFEVAHLSVLGDKYVVNLDTQDCSCRKWMITGTCCHALAAIRFLNLNATDYIPLCFRKSTFEEMYNSIIYPINGQNMWPTTDFLDVMPPHKRIMPGRPKKKRRLEQWELRKDDTQLRKGGHRKRCRVCRELGHNRTNCPQLPTQGQSSQPSDAPPQPTQPSQEPISATQQPTQPSQETIYATTQPNQPSQDPTSAPPQPILPL